MADERDDFERSEEPTEKRRGEAKDKGQVAKSRLVFPVVSLLFFMGTLHFLGVELLVRMERIFIGFFSLAGERTDLAREDLLMLAMKAGVVLVVVLVPFLVGTLAVEICGGLLQTGFLWATQLLRPDFSRVNPLSGFTRLWSLETVIELVKTLLCVLGLGIAGISFLSSHLGALSVLPSLEVVGILRYCSEQSVYLMKLSVGILTVFAILDYLFHRWQLERQLRMSRQEIKEEMREQEGDPHVKGRAKSIRAKMARQRMMADVAKADVIVTNPEELAVAIRYRATENAAPRVVAKGADHVARQIRAVARAHGIPIAENKPIARLLYRTVEVGKEIPENLYRAVAEVLAYVYRLRQGRGAPEKTASAER